MRNVFVYSLSTTQYTVYTTNCSTMTGNIENGEGVPQTIRRRSARKNLTEKCPAIEKDAFSLSLFLAL